MIIVSGYTQYVETRITDSLMPCSHQFNIYTSRMLQPLGRLHLTNRVLTVHSGGCFFITDLKVNSGPHWTSDLFTVRWPQHNRPRGPLNLGLYILQDGGSHWWVCHPCDQLGAATWVFTMIHPACSILLLLCTHSNSSAYMHTRNRAAHRKIAPFVTECSICKVCCTSIGWLVAHCLLEHLRLPSLQCGILSCGCCYYNEAAFDLHVSKHQAGHRNLSMQLGLQFAPLHQ